MLPFQGQSAVNFASHTTIHESQQFSIFCDFPAIIGLLSSKDPETPACGSL
ncbi:hypothetical protein AXQ97_004457 [Salmonella enterica subsp. enterica]|nr:hypothetical protein [Salmonella enterica subsp. enterica serovar Reading]EEI9132176.1 hypothetical protein [Salmonella enterica subsp. enterica serovar Miami]EEJ1579065.1 hypothetical protein [Salmonella enterica subsp. enterica serovar Miami]EEJ2838811.1 hypothetical protein [Salmonella enterica subsp. enterica serovar Miami]